MHNINMRIIISVLPDTKRVLRVKSCMCVYGLGVFQHWCFRVNKILVQSTKIFSQLENSLLLFLCSHLLRECRYAVETCLHRNKEGCMQYCLYL